MNIDQYLHPTFRVVYPNKNTGPPRLKEEVSKSDEQSKSALGGRE